MQQADLCLGDEGVWKIFESFEKKKEDILLRRSIWR